MNSFIFTHALILAIAWTYASDNRGRSATFVVVQVPVEYIPWLMLSITLLSVGWQAALSDFMGILAAHLYDVLTRLYPTFQGGRNWIQTPWFVQKAFRAQENASVRKGYGAMFRSTAAQARPRESGGWTSALDQVWGGRGAGRRLGGG